jgi:anti-sigma regulatory factor (Ser/Thr protein kinase)
VQANARFPPADGWYDVLIDKGAMREDELTCTLPAAPESVALVREALSRFVETRCPNSDAGTREAVRLAVSEACGNVVRHAYGAEDEGRLQVHAAHREVDVVVQVRDWGAGFGSQPRPGLGLGLRLMRELARSCEVRTCRDGGTLVTLVFNCGDVAVE